MAIISDIQMSRNSWFSDNTVQALTATYTPFEFGFASFSITLSSDAASGWIEYSFDGVHTGGRVKPGGARKMDFCRHRMIWLKGQTGGEEYRLEVY